MFFQRLPFTCLQSLTTNMPKSTPEPCFLKQDTKSHRETKSVKLQRLIDFKETKQKESLSFYHRARWVSRLSIRAASLDTCTLQCLMVWCQSRRERWSHQLLCLIHTEDNNLSSITKKNSIQKPWTVADTRNFTFACKECGDIYTDETGLHAIRPSGISVKQVSSWQWHPYGCWKSA